MGTGKLRWWQSFWRRIHWKPNQDWIIESSGSFLLYSPIIKLHPTDQLCTLRHMDSWVPRMSNICGANVDYIRKLKMVAQTLNYHYKDCEKMCFTPMAKWRWPIKTEFKDGTNGDASLHGNWDKISELRTE